MTKCIIIGTVFALFAASGSRAQSAYPKTFKDGKGHAIPLAAKPTRIACRPA